MITGIGVDIVDIYRIKKAMNRNSNFINKLFSKEEITYFESKNMQPEYVAGRFAAKEAVAKAIGTGFRGFSFKDIIIDRDHLGKPLVMLKENAKAAVKVGESFRIHISISHGQEQAIAYAVLEVEGCEDWHSRRAEKD